MFIKFIAVLFIVFFLILIHEFGHFIVARRNGVKVHEFAIGFAPFVFTKKMFGTLFKFGLMPLGGFVKLHGEDSSNPSHVNDNTSFVSKTPWQKTKIICAGVFMNFLVFWVLFTINLIVGSDPLILNQSDFQNQINQKEVILYHGSYVKNAADSNLIGSKVFEGESISTFYNPMGPIESTTNLSSLDVDLYPSVSLPVLNVYKTYDGSVFGSMLKTNDLILKVNNKIVFSKGDLDNLVSTNDFINLQVLRTNNSGSRSVINIQNQTPINNGLYVSSIVDDSVAFKAGVKEGMVLVSIEGVDSVFSDSLASDVKSILDEKRVDSLNYTFLNPDFTRSVIKLSPDTNGSVGMYLQNLNTNTNLGFDYFFDSQNFSVIQKPVVKFAWYKAPFIALSQGFDVAILSAKSIVSTFASIFISFEVSEQVGGPIQVFKTGFDFVEIGGTALMGFIAMISLTLAVVNILPIPALDGGRLLFVIIEAFRGKPLNPKYESIIHGIGFLLLLSLIFIISIFDIIRL